MQQIQFIDIFIDLFESALHSSGDKLAHLQEHFLTVYTAFVPMHRYCCRPVTRLRWISTLSPVGSNIGALYQNCIYSQKVLLIMGEFVARSM